EGVVAIGELGENEQIGREVYDANGITRVVAVKHNGRKQVYRVSLRNGSFVEATADHVVKAVTGSGKTHSWLRVDALKCGMRMQHFPLPVRELALVGDGSSDDSRTADGLGWSGEYSEEEIVSIEPLGVDDVY